MHSTKNVYKSATTRHRCVPQSTRSVAAAYRSRRVLQPPRTSAATYTAAPPRTAESNTAAYRSCRVPQPPRTTAAAYRNRRVSQLLQTATVAHGSRHVLRRALDDVSADLPETVCIYIYICIYKYM